MTTAHVELLTAEVRTLMVGSRQVTLSVYRQLDLVSNHAIEPFGRVHPDRADKDLYKTIHVVGRDKYNGVLVRAEARYRDDIFWSWNALPLIVLAGLR